MSSPENYGVGLCVCRQIHIKQLAHTIMEAGKSQDLQAGVSGEPTEWFQESGSQWARDPRRAKFQLESKGRKRLMPPCRQAGEVPSNPGFLFCSGLQLMGWGSNTLGRAKCFTQSTDSDINLIWNALTDMPKATCGQMPGHHMAQ